MSKKNGQLEQFEFKTKEQIIEEVWTRKGLLHMDNYKQAALEILRKYDEQIAASIGLAMTPPKETESAMKNFSNDIFKQKAWKSGVIWFTQRFANALRIV